MLNKSRVISILLILSSTLAWIFILAVQPPSTWKKDNFIGDALIAVFITGQGLYGLFRLSSEKK